MEVKFFSEIEALVASAGGGGGAIVVPEFVAGLAPNPVALGGLASVLVDFDDVVAGGHGRVAVGFLVVKNGELLLVIRIRVSGAGKPRMFVVRTIRFEGLPDRLHQGQVERNKCWPGLSILKLKNYKKRRKWK